MNTSAFDVLGVPVSVTTLASASSEILSWVNDSKGRFVCVRDVHGIMQARSDPALMRLHQHAALVTPDGMPLVWLGQRRGLPVERTCGPDLMERVIEDSASANIGHYFYGGKAGVAQALAETFLARNTKLTVAGAETPGFGPIDDREVRALARRITVSKARIVWVGLSTPKQEYLMKRLVPLVTCTLIGVGAAFDFHTGAIRRAPGWMQRMGLEWSFRLISEPRRLWRRYLVLAPQFLIALATEKAAGR